MLSPAMARRSSIMTTNDDLRTASRETHPMNRRAWLVTAAVVLVSPTVRAAEPFMFKDGDRVVLIGNTLIEREQRHGYWELALTRRNADRKVTFRNLGWSGDTVFGEARAGFGSVADGFKHLKEHVLSLKPTVIVVGYGGNEAFDGSAGLPRFVAGLNTLLDALAPAKARIVLLSPPPQEDLGRPLPDPTQQNKNLALYRDAIRNVAATRKLEYVDLHEAFQKGPKATPLTDNGIHLTARGYWHTATMLETALGHPVVPWRVDVAADGLSFKTSGTKVEGLGKGRFRVTDGLLPLPAPPEKNGAKASERVLRVQGLPAGKHTLSIDGLPIVTATAALWADGVHLERGPEMEQAERLRQTIVEKNRLYFHRWRPQNETYLFGFRKAEQGKNAVEIPQFDPLVAAQDDAITKLRAPRPHVYEIKPE